jgi:predicted nucleic acid-binding protein
MVFVLDASVTLAWHFEDEGGGLAEAVAQRAFREGVVVPQYWSIEVMSGLLRGERRRRTTMAGTAQFLERLANLSIRFDDPDAMIAARALMPLARAHRLSVYDAGYLELAEREGVPLATADNALRNAAQSIGVDLVEEHS